MSESTVSRRTFAMSLAALSGLPMTSLAQAAVAPPGPPDSADRDVPPDTPASKQNSPEKQPADQEPETPSDVPETAWLLGLILKRYADDRLDETAIRGILKDISADQRRSLTLKAFPLENADEPGLIFQPFEGP